MDSDVAAPLDALSFDTSPAQGAPRAQEAALAPPLVAVVPTGLVDVDELLPSGGFPRGAVTELAAADGLASSSTLALRAVASAQIEARLRGGESALAALVDPTRTFYGPAVRALGVDADRLLVVRPSLEAAARIAVRLAQSRAFSVVVVDTAGVPGARGVRSLAAWGMAVRRVALAVEGTDTCVVLLTALEAHRPLPLPVSMRLELREPARGKLQLRVAKERHGRVTAWRTASVPKTPRDGGARAS